MQEKYGVEETKELEETKNLEEPKNTKKEASSKTCPACSSSLEDNSNVNKCPTCGTSPFEKP